MPASVTGFIEVGQEAQTHSSVLKRSLEGSSRVAPQVGSSGESVSVSSVAQRDRRSGEGNTRMHTCFFQLWRWAGSMFGGFCLIFCININMEFSGLSSFIPESQNGSGWKGPYRASHSNPPAMGRDAFHQPRLPKAPSNLASNPSREGAATASLGSLGQGLTTLTGKINHTVVLSQFPSCQCG